MAIGGEPEPRRAVSAARQAWAAFDAPLAERLARAALEGGAGIEAAQLLSDLLVYGGRAREAEELLATLQLQPTGEEERARLGAGERLCPVLGAGPRQGGLGAPSTPSARLSGARCADRRHVCVGRCRTRCAGCEKGLGNPEGKSPWRLRRCAPLS
jgi:hypothetical protein